MSRSRWLSSALRGFLLVALLPGTPANAQEQVPLGAGARFVPVGWGFYAAANVGPNSPQMPFLDRLASVYLSAPEVDAARQELSEALPPYSPYGDVIELWDAVSPWLGDEVFLAAPSAAAPSSETANAAFECPQASFLVGAHIRDLEAFAAFAEQLAASLEDQGALQRTQPAPGTDVIVLGGRDGVPAAYAAVYQDYLLVAPDSQTLLAALAADSGGTLAASTAFQDAQARFGARSLAMVFGAEEDQSTTFGGGGVSQQSPSRWVAGGLQLGPESIRVDITSSLRTEALTPAQRDLLAKAPNPLRSLSAVPSSTAFFVGWDNLYALWQTVKESMGEEYQGFRQGAFDETGLDVDADVFDWMTGEFAVFAAPPDASSESLLGSMGLGLLIQAQDPTVAREKLDKIARAAAQVAGGAEPGTEEIAGISFVRLALAGEEALFAQVVDEWLVVTSSRDVAAQTVASIRGDGGLAGQEALQRFRSQTPEQQQMLGFVDVPSLVEITTSGVGAVAPDEAESAERLTRPIRSVGLSVMTTAEVVEAQLVAHVVPTEGTAAPAAPRPRVADEDAPASTRTILIDASRDRDAVWPAGSADFSDRMPTRGVPFLAWLSNLVGVGADWVLQPGQRFGRELAFGPDGDLSVVAPTDEPLVIRVGSAGTYTEEEIADYQQWVACGGRLLLLSDGTTGDERDELARAFGMEVGGTVQGDGLLSQLVPHAMTAGADVLDVSGGTGLLQWGEQVEVLGQLSPQSFLDLNGDGQWEAGEPPAAPALATVRFGRGVVVFLGTTAVVENPDHPLFQAVLRALIPDAPWYGPVVADAFEPDDTAAEARALEPGMESDARSIHVAGDQDWFKVGGEAEYRLAVDIGFPEQSCDLSVAVFGPDGTTEIVATPARYTLPTTGTYFLRVTAATEVAVCRAYTVTAALAEPVRPDAFEDDNSAATARPIAIGQAPQAHTIHRPADEDWVTFSLSAGQRVRIATTTPQCDTLLTLFGPDGATQLAEDDDGGRSFDSALTYVATQPGQYFARARLLFEDDTCESYVFSVEAVGP